MNTEKQERPQTTEPQASQVQQPLKDKAEAGWASLRKTVG